MWHTHQDVISYLKLPRLMDRLFLLSLFQAVHRWKSLNRWRALGTRRASLSASLEQRTGSKNWFFLLLSLPLQHTTVCLSSEKPGANTFRAAAVNLIWVRGTVPVASPSNELELLQDLLLPEPIYLMRSQDTIYCLVYSSFFWFELLRKFILAQKEWRFVGFRSLLLV